MVGGAGGRDAVVPKLDLGAGSRDTEEEGVGKREGMVGVVGEDMC